MSVCTCLFRFDRGDDSRWKLFSFIFYGQECLYTQNFIRLIPTVQMNMLQSEQGNQYDIADPRHLGMAMGQGEAVFEG